MQSSTRFSKAATSSANSTVQRVQNPTKTIVDNRPMAVKQRNFQEEINKVSAARLPIQNKASVYSEADLEDTNKLVIEGSFKANSLLFGSLNDKKIGSIYFEGGRIRLAHVDGPKISKYEKIDQYTVNKDQYEEFKKLKKDNKGKKDKPQLIFNGMQGNMEKVDPYNLPDHHKVIKEKSKNKIRLLEFFKDDKGNVTGFHPSRGGPVKVEPIGQDTLDELYQLVSRMGSKIEEMEKEYEKAVIVYGRKSPSLKEARRVRREEKVANEKVATKTFRAERTKHAQIESNKEGSTLNELKKALKNEIADYNKEINNFISEGNVFGK